MTAHPLLDIRSAGILLHPTSLPGAHGCGDLGAEARRFVDFLARAKLHWWQMLPVHPPGRGDSPYNALSAFAGSPLLVSLDELRREGLLKQAELKIRPRLLAKSVDFHATWLHREQALRLAYARAAGRQSWRSALDGFRAREADWVEDHALFLALQRAHRGQEWFRWEAPLRRRERSAIAAARKRLAAEVGYHAFVQMLFERQWSALRAYAAERRVSLLGDVPIFVAHHSTDVWANQDQFFLNAKGMPTVVAGVPPDAFSATGQRWGNPLYRWDRMRRGGYAWWLERIAMAARRFDIVRLDHFIGFQRYWEIRAQEKTAVKGTFRPGPRDDFFRAVRKAQRGLPFVAEDLGIVTAEVTALRERFGMPGLRVLQFAFDGDPVGNPHLPHNYPRDCVVYSGTHDNNTAEGWWREIPPRVRKNARAYAGEDAAGAHRTLMRLAWSSVANLAIVPLQDVLGLGPAARMNTPGTPRGNWTWRFRSGALTPQLADALGALTEATARAAPRWPNP